MRYELMVSSRGASRHVAYRLSSGLEGYSLCGRWMDSGATDRARAWGNGTIRRRDCGLCAAALRHPRLLDVPVAYEQPLAVAVRELADSRRRRIRKAA